VLYTVVNNPFGRRQAAIAEQPRDAELVEVS
jgi:hypothetical protein